MWDDIAILTRYLLMLSFNDCLDGKLFNCNINAVTACTIQFVVWSRVVRSMLRAATETALNIVATYRV